MQKEFQELNETTTNDVENGVNLTFIRGKVMSNENEQLNDSHLVSLKQLNKQDRTINIAELIKNRNTVFDLKELIFGKDFNREYLVKLIYCGKLLRDEDCISEYKINQNDSIFMVQVKRNQE